MAETLETKREGGARTRAMPMKRKKERVATCMVLETASLTGYGRKDGLIQQVKRQNRYLDTNVDHVDSKWDHRS